MDTLFYFLFCFEGLDEQLLYVDSHITYNTRQKVFVETNQYNRSKNYTTVYKIISVLLIYILYFVNKRKNVSCS